MDTSQLQQIEAEEGVAFTFRPDTKRLTVKGPDAACDRAIKRIAGDRDEVAVLLRERQGIAEDDEPIVEREIALNVKTLAVQRENYIRWFKAKPLFYQPTESELDKMFSALEEGDEIIFDFAQSFTVRKQNGLLVAVDRKGRVDVPSPYSPAMQSQKRQEN